MSKPIAVSIVSYTNTLPFKWALKHGPIRQQIDLQEDIPSHCARKLQSGQVDLALVPVALLAGLNHYFIETGYCIGANGIVDSVKLYSDVPLNEIRTVMLDYQSRTSVTLVRVLFRFFWKSDPLFQEGQPGFEQNIGDANAAVVIGDRTFALNGRFKYEFDLAEAWKQFTGLPFVFAAWVSTSKLPEEFIAAFDNTLRHGVNNIPTAIREEGAPAGLSVEQTTEYLTRRIDYTLDKEKMKALGLFLDYIRKL